MTCLFLCIFSIGCLCLSCLNLFQLCVIIEHTYSDFSRAIPGKKAEPSDCWVCADKAINILAFSFLGTKRLKGVGGELSFIIWTFS